MLNMNDRNFIVIHSEMGCKITWYSENLQVDCLINREQLTEEVDFLRKNLRLQKHYATLLQDLDKSTSMLGKILLIKQWRQ